jgi:outer membrane protein assembly factor BamA
VAKDFYIGPGYQLDIHYDIQQLNLKPGAVTPFDAYGYNSSSYSSGLALDMLYDTRKNSIDPEGGSFYGNVVFRQNLKVLGSDQNWNSVLVDVRKYFSVGHKDNVLAFWSYDWFTLTGQPPYLDLPSTAWDTYDNTGRGYVQSRFRGKSLLDLEGEFRFGILNNGLLGGVIFANCQSVSDVGTNRFEVFWPGAGAGLRIKFNKFSKTNIAIDYGFGLNGSRGLFLNLGEVF